MSAAANPFVPAVREAQKARIAFFGPSKSGKTLSALLVARGIVGEGKVAVIDTEGGRVNLYAGIDGVGTTAQPSGFDSFALDKPYHPGLVEKGIETARAAGYEIVIIDGISPFWDGPGGVMQIADQHTKGENKFSGWAVATPEHQKLIAAITHAPIHIICTIRAKVEYVVEQNDRGKNVPRKVGLTPVQRGGIEYEFDITGQLDESHVATLEARGPFEGMVVDRPGVAFGQQVRAWLDSGGSVPEPPAPSGAAVFQGSGSDSPAPESDPSPDPTPPAPVPAEPQPAAPASGGDPFGGSVPPAPSDTPALITPEQLARLGELAGKLVELDPSKGDAAARGGAMNEKAKEWYGKPILELSPDDAAKLIEFTEGVVLKLQEAKA